MKSAIRLSTFVGTFILIALAVAAPAAVPPLLTYQGRLQDVAGIPLTGAYSITFRIYDADINGNLLWTETQNLNIEDGLFSTMIGSLTALPSVIFSGDQRWLSISINADPELQPRRRIVTAAFAYNSLNSDSADFATSVGVNGVNSLAIQDFTIDVDDIKGGTITGDKIAADAIISSKISNGSIVGVDIAASQITTSHIVNGTLLGADFVNGSITGSQIADGSISAADMLPNSITGSEIQDLSILTADLSDGLITSLKIADGTVNSNDIGANAVGSSEIQSDAVSAAKILDEPGVAQNLLDGSFVLAAGSAFQNVLSRSINCPAAGYVLAMASCVVYIDNLPADGTWIVTGVSAVSQSLDGDQQKRVASSALDSATRYFYPITAQKAFPVSAGAHTFYLVTKRELGVGETSITNPTLTLVYLPTSYGTVGNVE